MKKLSSSFGLLAAAVFAGAFTASAGETLSAGKQTVDLGPGRTSPFPWRFTVDLLQGYDSNVFTESSNSDESFFSNIRLGVAGNFGNSRTRVSLNLDGGATYFWDRPGDSVDYDVSLGLGIVHRLTPRLLLTTNTSQRIQSEPDFALVSAASRRVDGEYLYGVTRYDLSYQWAPRFQTVSSYTLINLLYFTDSPARAEDRLEHYFGQQFRYLWTPTTTLVGEYRYGYVDVLDFPRDSSSNYFLAGADFIFNPRFTGGFRAGVELRDYQKGGSESSPFAEGNVSYAYGPYGSALALVTRYGLEQPDDVLSQSRETFRIGLKLNHGINSRLSMQLETYYQHNSASSRGGLIDGYDEDIYDVVAGVRYLLTRNLSLRAGYSYTVINSDDAFREYERNRVWLGASLAF